MSAAPKPPKEISHTRIIVARLFGAVAVFFSSLWLLGNAFVMLQAATGAYEGPEGMFVILFFTGPPMFLAAVIAMLLVGFRRCKLAWIAFGLYALPFFALVVTVLVEAILKAFHLK